MKLSILAMALVTLVGCKPYKINASRAHLFDVKECENSIVNGERCLHQRHDNLNNSSENDNNLHPYFGSNPIFVAADSKFSIELNAIKPPSLSYSSKKSNSKELLTRKYGPLSNNIVENNFRNKQLWLLTTVRSQNITDPLEANSKVYIKSTQVKWDSGSHLLIPLDKDEKFIFTHESDFSYRVGFQLMEVDSLAVKKQLAVLRNQSGLLSFVEAGVNTLTDLLNTAIGKDYINEKINPILQNDTAFQRFLLSIGASVEFFGEVLVLRDSNSFIKKFPGDIEANNEYFLVDGFRLASENKSKEIDCENCLNWQGIQVGLDDGGISKNGNGIEIPLKHYAYNGNSPGYISFNVSQIPVRVNDINNKDSNHLNTYYDYSRMQKFLAEFSNELFSQVIDCKKLIDFDLESNRELGFECMKLLSFSGLAVKEKASDEEILNNSMFVSDIRVYSGLEKKYEEAGDKLTCLQIFKNIDSINQVIIDNINVDCDKGFQMLSKTQLDMLISESRDEKNRLDSELESMRMLLTSKIYENIQFSCKQMENKTINILMSELDYNCSLFEAISTKQNSYDRLIELIHRQSD